MVPGGSGIFKQSETTMEKLMPSFITSNKAGVWRHLRSYGEKLTSQNALSIAYTDIIYVRIIVDITVLSLLNKLVLQIFRLVTVKVKQSITTLVRD